MLLRRNIRFALTYSVFISSFCCLDALVYVLIGAEGHTLEALPMRCLRRVIFAVAVHLPYFIIAEKNIRAAMGRVPDLVPVFRTVSLPEAQGAPAAFLETGLQGNVVSLKAANQYVVVFTGEAEHLLRMTLKEAIDLLPPQTGLRVHRSWWLSRQELSGASLNKATGVLVTVTGRTYPVGKTKLAEVQALIGRPLSAVKG